MRYLVRERIFAIKDDFWVTDEHGNRVFFINARFLSLHHTLVLEDVSGNKLAATVHKAVFSPLHHKAMIDLHHGGRLEAVGNIIDKDFEIRDGHRVVARVSRKWFRMRDTYGLDVAPDENDALFVAIAVCLDRIHHEEEERHG